MVLFHLFMRYSEPLGCWRHKYDIGCVMGIQLICFLSDLRRFLILARGACWARMAFVWKLWDGSCDWLETITWLGDRVMIG